MNPERLRAEIPALDAGIYLNTGASSPSPRRVVDAAAEFERRLQYDAPCGEGMYGLTLDAMDSARERVAAFLGADPGEIALTDSTTEGINHVAAALDWEQGDVVVRTDLEHPAGELPWARLQRRAGIEVRELATERGRLDREELKAAVDGARLVCLSSLTWTHGTRLPVPDIVEIAHDAGARVLVDAVQSVGQLPVDVTEWGADFVAASSHKWLLGLWGGGFLYVDSDALGELDPAHIGYASVEDPEAGADYTLRNEAKRFELGTTAVAPYVALETAIETMAAVGLDTVESHIAGLRERLEDGLGDRLVSPPGARSGLVTFAAENPQVTVDRLADKGVHIRSLPDPDACRVSIHVFNTAEDIDRLLDVL